MVVKSNIQAMSADRHFGIVTSSQEKSTEKLSSGYKINRSADDAAGLAISEKMRRQIRGLTQASNNAQDGISFVQIADGALEEVDTMLHRATELAVKAANETNTDEDRSYIQQEIDQLTSEINRISSTTVFNEINVFATDDASPMVAPSVEKANSGNQISIEWSFVDSSGNPVTADASQAVGKDTSYANSTIAQFVKTAAEDAVAKLQSAYPDLMTAASSGNIQIGLNLARIDGTGNVLASAALSLSSRTASDGSGSTMMTYTLNVDTADYPMDQFDTMTDEKKADLAATISHEMTHLIMYDTLTNGMFSGRTTSFPDWFVEGMAQTSSGDNGWVSNRLSASSDDTTIKNYMSQLSSMPYGAGYLATMYLGQAVYENSQSGGSQTVTSANIKAGLNKLMTEMAQGKTLDQAIADNTTYGSTSAFESAFKNADTASLTFVKNLLAARGTGAGSLLAADLSVAEKDAFAPGSLTATATNYFVKTDNTEYANAFGTGYTFPEKKKGVAGGGGSNSDELFIQVGAEAGQHIALQRYDVSTDTLFGGASLDVTTTYGAGTAIDTIKSALTQVSFIRSNYGSVQNRLEHTINNLDNIVENTTSAESLIRDTDIATEMVKFSNNNILQQAGASILSQANQANQGVLSLLG